MSKSKSRKGKPPATPENDDESNKGAVGGGVMEAAEGEVTMATVREMLRVQESVMKTLFESTSCYAASIWDLSQLRYCGTFGSPSKSTI